MKRKYLLWVFICSSLLVWFVVVSPLNKEDPQDNVVDINLDALRNGDKADSKVVSGVTKRPFKNIQLSNNQSNFDADALEAITDTLAKVIMCNNDDQLPALDEGKRADLLALKIVLALPRLVILSMISWYIFTIHSGFKRKFSR